MDTAGLRDTNDPIERLGIEVSQRYLADADVVLACAENLVGLEQTRCVIARSSTAPILSVRTKADLVSTCVELNGNAIAVSAETGAGVQELLDAINNTLVAQHGEIAPDLPLLTRARHRHALGAACAEIEEFDQAWRERQLPAPVASVHLRTAVYMLEDLIGSVDVEDVLDRVFSSFCVGK